MLEKIKKTDRYIIYTKLYKFIAPLKRKLFSLTFFKFYSMILTIITPIFYKILVDDVMIGGKIEYLIFVILGYIGVYALQTLGIVYEKRSENSFLMPFALKLRTTIFRKYIDMPTELYSKYDVGDLKTRLDDDVNKAREFVNEHVVGFVFAVANVVVIGVIMLFMKPLLALFGFAMVPLSFLFAKFMSKKAKKVSDDYRSEWGKYQGFLHVSLQNWKEIKSNNLEQNEEKVLSRFWDKLTPLFIKQQVYWYINRGFIAFKNLFITKMNIYFIGGLLIINGHMTVGLLLAFMSYFDQFFSNISKLTELQIGLKSELPALDRMLEIINIFTPEKINCNIDKSNIRLEDVSFSYSNAKEVLRNVSFEVLSGERVAIVGKSGCGKSTLIKLLCGIFEPQSGDIFLGDNNIDKLDNNCINKYISSVMQDPLLFNITLRENLTLYKKNINDDELADACKKADIYSFIQGLPIGFDTIIGERGIKLSGGQKQRIAIARILLLDPECIVFDEATSSLDNESEKNILSTIRDISVGKTVITVAHRLSTVIDADKVFVMDKGRIIASGHHTELIDNCEIYDLLFKKQYNNL